MLKNKKPSAVKKTAPGENKKTRRKEWQKKLQEKTLKK